LAGQETPPTAIDPPRDEPPLNAITRQTLRSAPIPFEQDRPTLTLPPGATIVLVAGADALADHLAGFVRARGFAVHRVYWDSPVECPAATAGLILLAPVLTKLSMLATAFRWLRASAPSLKETGEQTGSLFATISRLDGAFGLNRLDAESIPFGG